MKDLSDTDELYQRAVGVIALSGPRSSTIAAATSLLMRRLRIGAASAARLIERAEADGLIAKPNHVGKRELGLERSTAMRSMDTAPKNKTPILARIRQDLVDLFPHYGGRDAMLYAGRFVVISHPGGVDDGFDVGWSLAGPFGICLGHDEVFEGWWPLPPVLASIAPA